MDHVKKMLLDFFKAVKKEHRYKISHHNKNLQYSPEKHMASQQQLYQMTVSLYMR